MGVSRVRKVRLLKILLIPLVSLFIFSAYNAFYEFSYYQYKVYHPPSVTLKTIDERYFVEDDFTLTLKVENVPDYQIFEDSLRNLMTQLNPKCILKELNIQNILKDKIAGWEIASFDAEATYFSNTSSPKSIIINKYLHNLSGDSFPISGVFPEIKELGTFRYTVSNNKIVDGDDFSIRMDLENVNRISKLPKIKFPKIFGTMVPTPINKAVIDKSKGIKNTYNFSITQKFRATSSGLFNTAKLEYMLREKVLSINPYSVLVEEIKSSYEIEFDKPAYIDDRFYIKVTVHNVPNNTRQPIFPNIKDCKKEKIKTEKNKINNKYSTITYVQNYTLKYDGVFEVDDLIVYMGKEKEKYKLSSFEVEYDCSSINKVRLANGTEPVKLSGRAYGSNNDIVIENKNSEDIFVKVIKVSTKKARRSIYIRATQKATVNDLPSGTYYLAVAYGSHWDFKKQNFHCDKSFTIFDNSQNLITFKSNDLVTWSTSLTRTVSAYPDAFTGNSIEENSFNKF